MSDAEQVTKVEGQPVAGELAQPVANQVKPVEVKQARADMPSTGKGLIKLVLLTMVFVGFVLMVKWWSGR